MPRKDGITRRDAVKVAGATGVALGIAATANKRAPAFLKSVHAANNQVPYGIIGTGGRGQYLLGLLKGVDNGRCLAGGGGGGGARGGGGRAGGGAPGAY